MRRTPEHLAAIASAAVPLLSARAVAAEPDDAADFDAALIQDGAGRTWRVRSPRHPEASLRLENELTVLRSFTPAVRADLPFELPTVAGTVRQGPLTTFVYSHLPGERLRIDDVRSRVLAPAVGRSLAAIHGLSPDLVEDAGLPSYTANEFRQRRLNELDQAAGTARIPTRLLRRWENALEDVSLWRFAPTVVHGDLHEDHVLVDGDRVTAVSGWTDLHIGDPADDFAWLVACNDQSFVDVVLEAYSMALPEPEDPHLMHRAALSAEFALAKWLVRGVTLDDADMIDEARQMLDELDHDVERTGGWELSTPPPAPASVDAGAGPGSPDAGVTSSDDASDDVSDDEVASARDGADVPDEGVTIDRRSGSQDAAERPARPTGATRISEPDAVTTRHPIIAHPGPEPDPAERPAMPAVPPSIVADDADRADDARDADAVDDAHRPSTTGRSTGATAVRHPEDFRR
ncbi:macrolide 2'-phosphotransferase [Tersicoccus sp. Bi-70]|uniref:macrolide 2'-phosphotransferase n=1 Tax=Tersicoccus sp. Bi-70 TaxID=1897634 RepID=UPI0009FA8C86|nr:macrolide 2'-phosphotransferase [Tersicoccus sp. Bi-70]